MKKTKYLNCFFLTGNPEPWPEGDRQQVVPAPSLGLGYLCQGASGGENQVGFNFNVVIEDTYFSNDFLFYKVFYLTWIENKNKNSKMCIDILTLVLLQLSV